MTDTRCETCKALNFCCLEAQEFNTQTAVALCVARGLLGKVYVGDMREKHGYDYTITGDRWKVRVKTDGTAEFFEVGEDPFDYRQQKGWTPCG